jgi:hypothetical protein
MIWWDEKRIPFCINLHKNKIYNVWSALLPESGPGLLFNCAPTSFVYASPHTIVAKVEATGTLIQVEFLYYDFPLFKWDPYPLFYRLEGVSYLVECLAMHG